MLSTQASPQQKESCPVKPLTILEPDIGSQDIKAGAADVLARLELTQESATDERQRRLDKPAGPQLMRSYVYAEIDGKTKRILTEEEDAFLVLENIHNLVRDIGLWKRPIFSIDTRTYRGHGHLIDTGLAGRVLRAFEMDLSVVGNHFPNHRISPYAETFIRHAECVDSVLLRTRKLLNELELKQLTENLNSFIDTICKEVSSKEFHTKLSNHTRRANKNQLSLSRYIDKLYERYSRYLVLRIDFAYRKSPQWAAPGTGSSSYSQIKADLRTMLRYLKKNFPLCGYAWKIEHGLQKEFHVHALIFLRGDRIRKDVLATEVIGEHWIANVTQGRGLYFNCNAIDYEYRGVGMISRRDTEELANLKKYVAPYLTKTDHLMEYVPPDGGRSFGKGVAPKPAKDQRGRPTERAA